MNKENIVRCVNTATNKVKYFPESICYNKWWQKNTKFIPQPLETSVEPEPSIIYESASDSVSVNTEENTSDVESDANSGDVVKKKRKSKKQKSENGTD